LRYSNSVLKEKLEFHYKAFDISSLAPDPAEFLRDKSTNEDIEIAGLISSVMAYGNVKQINATLKALFTVIGLEPFEFIRNFKIRDFKEKINLKHRFYTTSDIITFLIILSRIVGEYGSIKNYFLSQYRNEDESVKNMLERAPEKFLALAEASQAGLTPGVRFMFPKPSGGSACKRMNLFLRWMVRKDSIDYGIWSEIPASKLIIPVDTHIAKIAQKLRLTKRKNVSWKMAEEITENLRKFDPEDPVKYDFALCHIVMRKLSF